MHPFKLIPSFLHQLIFFVYICGGVCAAAHSSQCLSISKQEGLRIGYKIWGNECGHSVSGLTAWNAGENFASMGIGHFIWFPKGLEAPYEEQFPKVLAFLEENGVVLPTWLKSSKACPWDNREIFLQEMSQAKLAELRRLLLATIDLQVLFMSKRLEEALPKMLQSLTGANKVKIRTLFYRLAENPNGLYALLDYTHFKGEGTSPKERYKGEGWGLLQVLEQMAAVSEKDIVKEFVSTAKKILSQRVHNAPPQREEVRWLKGWFNRLESY